MSVSTYEFPKILSTLDQLRFKSKVQSEFKRLTSDNPQAILKYCLSQRSRGTKEQEAVIVAKGGVELVTKYMKELQIKEWKESEPVLATDGTAALWYAMLLKRPFPEGEPAIAKSARDTFLYSTEILKARFKAGEANMKATKPGFWKAYQEEFGQIN